MKLPHLAFSLAVGLAAAAPAQACFQEIPVTRQLVEDAAGEGMTGFAGDARLPAFLVGDLYYLRPSAQEAEDSVSGAVLFVRRENGWRAFVPAEGESLVGLYISTQLPTVIAVTQRQVGGPVPAFTVMRSTNGLRSAACRTLAFPALLNAPSWMNETLSLEGVQIDGRGRARLVASALIDTDVGNGDGFTTWWRYDSADSGQRWSPPRRTAAAEPLASGHLRPMADTAPDALTLDLLNSVKQP